MAEERPVYAEAEIRLWGTTVGALVELETGRIIFEYSDDFRRRGLEISPIHLPTRLAGPLSFDALRRLPAFLGLPGVFSDALPDAFGRSVIRAYYETRGESRRAFSPVHQLLYVGERALGALSFHPAEEAPTRPGEQEAMEVQALAHDARRIVQGEVEVAIPEIYRIGSSAGGQRPKAIVLFDPESRTIRSGGAPAGAGEVPCIVKFDGVGGEKGVEALGPPQHFNRVEAAYRDMAVAAGVEMGAIDVLEIEGYVHLLVHRFDIRGGGRLHQHTFGGMIHVDYNEPGASSYEEYFRTVLRLGMAYDSLRQAFQRMVFNVMAINQDDHVKNLSFHMDPSGRWALTPAYDVTFAYGEGWTRTHQLRIRDRTTGTREAGLVGLARDFGIKKPQRLLERARSAIADWERFAGTYGVPARAVKAIRRALNTRDAEIKGEAG
ncbi:MAG: type II toxin-antitoxin system HipA family toxin [Gemmatimonadota bacterium]